MVEWEGKKTIVTEGQNCMGKRKMSKTTKIIIWVASAALLIEIGVILFVIFGSSKKGNNTGAPIGGFTDPKDPGKGTEEASTADEDEERKERLQSLMAERDLENIEYICEPGLARDWQKAYVLFLQTAKSEGIKTESDGNVPLYDYTIFDMDEDGTPELLIGCVNPEGPNIGDMYFGIFRFKDGKVECLKMDPERSVEHYIVPGKGVLDYLCYHDYVYAVLTKLVDGKIVSEELCSESIEGMDSEQVKEPEDLIDGIRGWGWTVGNCYLPIFEFYGVPETKDSCTNEEVRKKITDTYEKNGTIVYCASEVGFDNIYEEKKNYDGKLTMEEISFDQVYDKLGKGTSHHVTDAVWGDLNDDGQEECIVHLDSVGQASEASLILSLQNGHVYAYPEYGKLEIRDGKLRLPNEDGDPWEWKFHFYKNQFYSVYD